MPCSEDAKAEWEASSRTPATCGGQGAARAGARAARAAGRSLVTFPCLSAGSEHSTPQKKRRFLTLESKGMLEPRNQRIAENGDLFPHGRSEPEVADAVLAAIMADEEVTDATLADFTADEEVMTALRDRLGDQPAQVEPETTHVISHEQVQLEAIDYSKQVTTGQVRMTPEQKALYIARQRMQISRTDTEMYQVVHTLALALGAIRTEAGTHKALFAALVLLNRPEMSEQEVCASTGTSIASCKKWQRKVRNAQAGLPLTSSANASY